MSDDLREVLEDMTVAIVVGGLVFAAAWVVVYAVLWSAGFVQ